MIDIQIPKLGMSTVEVDVLSVQVVPGQHVSEGDELLEIEGDKSSLVVDAPVSGTVVEVLVAGGDVTQVGAVVCRLEPD